MSDDDVHQPRCPDYDLPGFATGQGGEHLVRREREGLGGGLVCLEGESGAGKSALLRRGLAIARAQGVLAVALAAEGRWMVA